MGIEFCFNEEIEKLPHLRMCAQKVGLNIIEKEDAYDMYGNQLENTVAIYAEKNSEELGILYELSSMINSNIRKQLRNFGINPNEISKVMPDSYTWETYFPEVKDKMQPIDIDSLYEKAKAKHYRLKTLE